MANYQPSEEGHLYTSEPIPLHSFIPSSLFESVQTEQQISEIISDGDSFNTSADLSAPSYALIIVLSPFTGQNKDIHQMYRPSGKHQGIPYPRQQRKCNNWTNNLIYDNEKQ